MINNLTPEERDVVVFFLDDEDRERALTVVEALALGGVAAEAAREEIEHDRACERLGIEYWRTPEEIARLGG